MTSGGPVHLQTRSVTHRGHAFVVKDVAHPATALRLRWKDGAGAALGTFDRLKATLKAEDGALEFAMNAGMFTPAGQPVGLHVEDGAELSPLNRDAVTGNFFLLPNGVFAVAEGRAVVMETSAWAAAGLKPALATQSGPLLVIRGALHPAFREGSPNLTRRNGVGVTPDGGVVLAISEGGVNFHDFATLFRDVLHCPHALYLDGYISGAWSEGATVVAGREPFVGLLAVVDGA